MAKRRLGEQLGKDLGGGRVASLSRPGGMGGGRGRWPRCYILNWGDKDKTRQMRSHWPNAVGCDNRRGAYSKRVREGKTNAEDSWTVARSDSPGRPHDAAPATAAQNAQIAPPPGRPSMRTRVRLRPITREKPPSSVDPRQSASAGRVLGRTVPVWAVSSTPPAPSTALRDMNSRDRLRISDPSTSPRCEAAVQAPGGGITRAPYPDILVQVASSRTPSSPSSTPPHLRRVLLVTTTLEHFHGGLSNGLATEATPESARCIALARLRHRALWWPASRAPCGFGPSATIRRPFPPARARTSARDRPGSASLKHSSCPRPSLPYFQAPPRSCAR